MDWKRGDDVEQTGVPLDVGMKWTADGPTAYKSPDGKHVINRSPQEGFGHDGKVTYMLVTDGAIVSVERDVYDSPEERNAAVRRLRALCGA